MDNISTIRKKMFLRVMVFTGAFLLLAGCAGLPQGERSETEPDPAAEKKVAVSKPSKSPDAISTGDLVTVHYNLRLDGSRELISTTSESVTMMPEEKKADWFRKPTAYGPQQVIAGDQSNLPAVSGAVVGMAVNEKKTVHLPPDKSFGAPDPKKKVALPLIKTIPLRSGVSPQHFVSAFGQFPVVGDEIATTPYFKSKVVEVKSNHVILEALPQEQTEFEHDFGTTRVTFDDEQVTMVLDPTIGANYQVNDRKGRIAAVEENAFVVDFNHPGAGRSLLLEIEVVSFEKQQDFMANQLDWIEDHDAGYEAATKEKKPMVMVLYAGWCGWSKKLMEGTIKDPRVQDLWDEFVWVKVDSDQQKEYKEIYGQNGYPMVIMTDEKGEIINKVDGYRDPRIFQGELRKCLHSADKS